MILRSSFKEGFSLLGFIELRYDDISQSIYIEPLR